MKYASFRMRSGKRVHGMVTRTEWLSTSKDQSHYLIIHLNKVDMEEYIYWKEVNINA